MHCFYRHESTLCKIISFQLLQGHRGNSKNYKIKRCIVLSVLQSLFRLEGGAGKDSKVKFAFISVFVHEVIENL